MPIGLWTAARGSSDNLVHVAGGQVESRQEGVHDVYGGVVQLSRCT